MFDKYSYKQKLLGLSVLFLMLSYTAYKRSFSSLISVVEENRQLADKVALLDKSKDVDVIQSELKTIDKVIGKEGVGKEEIQQNIISFVTRTNSNISIYDLQAIHQFSDENYTIYTNQLDVTGNLNQLMTLAYEFEKKFSLSRVINLNFYTEKKNNKQDVLHLKMLFQNYESNK